MTYVAPKKWPTVDDNPSSSEVALNLRRIFNTLNDHDQAINTVYANGTSGTSSTSSTGTPASSTSSTSSSTPSSTTTGVSSFNGSTGDVTFFQGLGSINDQSSTTSYTTQTSDNGALIVFNTSSAVAVTLNYNVTLNYYTCIANYGTNTVTLTPDTTTTTSTITYSGHVGASSLPVISGFSAYVYFDGKNWWAIQVPINSGTVGTITGVTAGTGLTGGGTSGTVNLALSTPVSVENGGTGTATPSLVAGTNITIVGTWPNQTVSSTGSSGSASLLSNGYQVFGSGLILQWGSTYVDTFPNVTFPMVFPNACLQPFAVTYGSIDRITYVVSGTVTTSGMTVANNGTGVYANWFAIGY